MQVLIANLKHLYQRRHLWPIHAFLGLLLFISIANRYDREVFVMVWYGSVIIGLFVGVTSKELIDKPFIRCLPGHLGVVRRMVFLIGAVFSLSAGALFMSHCRTAIWRSPTLFCAAAFLSMAMYLAAMEWTFLPSEVRSSPGGILSILAIHEGILFALAIAAIMLVGTYHSAGFELMILRHPLWMIGVGVLAVLGAWFQMGRHKRGRRLVHQGLYFGNSDRQRQLYRVFERRFAAGVRAMAATESLFLGRMKDSPRYSGRRYVWGILYVSFGVLAAWWKSLLYAFVGVTLLSGYLGWTAIFIFAWIAWMADQRPSWPPLHSALLVPAGRRERFLGTMSLAAATTGIVMFSIAAVGIVSVPLSKLIPELEIRGMSLIYHPVSIKNVWAPLAIIPLHAAMRMLSPKRWWFVVDISILLLIPVLAMAGFLAMLIVFHGSTTTLAARAPAWIAGTVIFAWILLLATCRHRTQYGPLAGQ